MNLDVGQADMATGKDRKSDTLSFIEKLLDGVEVEWKTFGKVAKVQRGASPRPIAKYITESESGIPWIKIGDTSPRLKYVKKKEILYCPTL